MSECRSKVYFDYAERRGNEGEALNGCPEGGVVKETKTKTKTKKDKNYERRIIFNGGKGF